MSNYIQLKKRSLNIDIDKELGTYQVPKPQLPSTPPKQPGLFIKGPIPLDWLRKANSLGGSVGAVATALWFYVGITGSKTVRLDSKIDSLTGITRQTRQNILKRLERIGLIKIFPRQGGYPVVTIL